MAVKAGCCGREEPCCRMVVSVKRVFDGCRLQDENVNIALSTEESIPSDATFVSARIIGSELTNYSISSGGGECSRVVGDILTRMAVTYESGGRLFTVSARHTESVSVRLRLPSQSIVPYNIVVESAISVGSGVVVNESVVTVSGCFLRIIKVVADVDILVPTYGYCSYPPSTGGVCSAFTNRVVFPIMGGDG